MTGKLRRNSIRRWEISDGDDSIELSSGSRVELQIAGVWILTRIEHDGQDYYAINRGIALVEGLRARLPQPSGSKT